MSDIIKPGREGTALYLLAVVKHCCRPHHLIKSAACACELHYGHCPAIVIPSAESAIGRLKGGFTELLAWVDMVSDEEAVGRCCHGRADV